MVAGAVLGALVQFGIVVALLWLYNAGAGRSWGRPARRHGVVSEAERVARGAVDGER